MTYFNCGIFKSVSGAFIVCGRYLSSQVLNPNHPILSTKQAPHIEYSDYAGYCSYQQVIRAKVAAVVIGLVPEFRDFFALVPYST